MINALQAAKISRKAPMDHEVYWGEIQKEIEVEITSAAKYGNTQIEFYVEKHRASIAAYLMNLGFRVEYNPEIFKDDDMLKISWSNKNIQAGKEIYLEEHICTCEYCKKEMK